MARKKIGQHTEDGSDCGGATGQRADREMSGTGLQFVTVSIRLDSEYFFHKELSNFEDKLFETEITLRFCATKSKKINK